MCRCKMAKRVWDGKSSSTIGMAKRDGWLTERWSSRSCTNLVQPKTKLSRVSAGMVNVGMAEVGMAKMLLGW